MPGYFTDKMALSDEPVLGDWKIVASLNGVEKEAKITIDKYGKSLVQLNLFISNKHTELNIFRSPYSLAKV